MASRRILAIWLPALAMDRWQLAHAAASEAEPQPRVLISDTAHGPRIDAVDRAATAAGARRGMMLADARTLCPALQTAPADPAGDLAFLEKLAIWAMRWGPWSALDPPDGLLVDITAVPHLFGGEAALLRDVHAGFARRRLAIRAAIAPTAGAAWAVAHFGAKTVIVGGDGATPTTSPPSSLQGDAGDGAMRSVPSPDARHAGLPRGCAVRDDESEAHIARALHDLPVAALRLDTDVLTVLRRLGIKRLGELGLIEGGGTQRDGDQGDGDQGDGAQNGSGRDAIQRRFRNRRSPAANPLIRLDQLLGRVPEPLLPVVPQQVPLVQRRLMEPIRHRALLDQVLDDLAQDMARELEGRSLGARRLELGLWRVDGEVIVRRLEMAAATRDAAHVCRLFAARLDDVDAGFGIEMLRLRASWSEPLALDQGDFEAAAERHGTSLSACIDRLTVRLGPKAVARPVPFASHIPERAQRWHPPLEPEPTSQGTFAFHHRPLKMLDKAEKIAVLYATPDGYPKRFRWRGFVHEVARVEGPERIAPEWWRERGTARLRDYYRIEDGQGRRYWIYRLGLVGDGRGGLPDWYLQGLCA